MPTVKIAMLAAALIGLACLVAGNDKNADEQQNSSSKAAAGQQMIAQKPAEEPDADEEGEEGPATSGAVAAEKPAPQQTSGKQFIYNFDGDTSGQPPAKFHAARTGLGAQSRWSIPQPLPNRTLLRRLQQTKPITASPC